MGPARCVFGQYEEGLLVMADMEALKDAVIKGDPNKAKELVSAALDSGMGPEQVLKEGLIAGMNVVGAAFKKNEVYVPEVLIAARAMKMAMELLAPKLAAAGVEPIGKVLIGTVQGDLHDIGKNLVVMMLKGAGFEVIDVGVDVTPEKFLEEVQSSGVKLMGLSALLTTTMPMLDKTINIFKTAGMDTKIMIGGAPITQEYAEKIGAAGYAPDAATAVDVVKELLEV